MCFSFKRGCLSAILNFIHSHLVSLMLQLLSLNIRFFPKNCGRPYLIFSTYWCGCRGNCIFTSVKNRQFNHITVKRYMTPEPGLIPFLQSSSLLHKCLKMSRMALPKRLLRADLVCRVLSGLLRRLTLYCWPGPSYSYPPDGSRYCR